MYGKLTYIEFLVFLVLLSIQLPHLNVTKKVCARDNSRLIRKLLHLKWMPILERYKVKLPKECPLHPSRDVFGLQQKAKKQNRRSQWTCKLCGKSFYEERSIDAHFDNRHKSHIHFADDAVCLADFCDIMRCEVYWSQNNDYPNGGSSNTVTDIEIWRDSSTLSRPKPYHVATTNEKKKSLSLSNGLSAVERLLQLLPTYDPSCKEKERKNILLHPGVGGIIFGGKKSKRNADTPTNCQEKQKQQTQQQASATSDNNSNTNNANNNINNNNNDQNGNNFQKLRATCKDEELLKMKSRCEVLVRICIASLLLQMSDYAFKEMEDELNKAICWYLTCDRYWEDGPLEPRSFPWGLIIVLIMVLSLGICFCYYIIWILFDSEEGTYYSTIQNASNRSVGGNSSRYMKQNYYDGKKEIISTSVPGSMSGGGGQMMPYDAKYHQEDMMMNSDRTDVAGDHYIYVTYPPDLKKRLLVNPAENEM